MERPGRPASDNPAERPPLPALTAGTAPGKAAPKRPSSRAPSDASGVLEGWSDADDWSRVSAAPEVYSVSPSASPVGSDAPEPHFGRPSEEPPKPKPAPSSTAQPAGPGNAASSRPAQPSRLGQSSEITPAEPSPALQPSPSHTTPAEPAEPANPAAAKPAWGAWGAFSGWKDAITQDVRQLTEKFQHALEDSEDEDARSNSTPTASTSSPRHRAPGRPESPLSAEAIRRQAVLNKLQGGDNTLEVGLKVCLSQCRMLGRASLRSA